MIKIKKDAKTTTALSLKGVNPYKALNVYEETDQKVFEGRKEDTEKLFQLVKFNRLSVIFGKSGIGKTSLLNAGLSPLLREKDFRPIRIRLNFSKNAPPLKEQICSAFEAGLAPNEIDKSKIELESIIEEIKPDPISPYETLWEYFHRVIHFKFTEEKEKRIVIPVLVFDQFEEIFTVGPHQKERNSIIDELYWLIEDQLPSQIRDRVLDGDVAAEKLSYLELKPQFKVILSLREDYLPHLNDLKTRLPSIDRALSRINYLNGKQARDVIRIGYSEESCPVILRCFYPEDIRKDQKETLKDESLEVEPVFLSLLCHQLFEKQPLKSITKQDQHEILSNFYNSVMNEFQEEIRIFVEEKLLTEGGFRTPFYLAPGEPFRDSINQLVDQRILRKFHIGKREYVEIIHDVLAPIIKEQRNKRLERIREQKTKEQLKKRFYRKVIGAISGIAFITLLIAVYAFYQKSRLAEQNVKVQIGRITTQALQEFPKDNTKAIRIAEEAIKRAEGNPELVPFKVLSDIGYSSYHRPFYINEIPLKSRDVVNSAVFSADSQCILTSHDDGTAQIRDLVGNCLLELKGHKKRILSAVFSPDETLILTASWDKTARLWNREGEFLKELKHDGSLTSASFSPDGKLIVTTSTDNTARLWDLDGSQLKVLKHTGRVISAVFSPNGDRILTASWDKTAKLWDLQGKLLVDLSRHNNTLSSAIFSPDGRYILTSSWDKTAILWDEKGRQLYTFEHDSQILSALFSPDGKFILTAALDGTVKIWKWEGAEFKSSIKHEGNLSTVAYSPDGHLILTASENGTVKLWDLQGNHRAQFDKHGQKIGAVAFSPDGRYLFTSSHDESAILWELQSNILIYLKHKEQVSDVVFSPDGKSILSISQDGIVRLWDDNGNFLKSFSHGHEGKIINALLSPKMDFLLTAASNGTIKRWDRKENYNNNKTLISSGELLTRAIFSMDGSRILTISSNKSATLWNMQGDMIRKFKNICKAIFSSNGGNLITVSCGDGVVKLWNLDNDNHKIPISTFNQGNIASAVFSTDGGRIFIVSKTGETVVRDLLSGEILHKLNLEIKNSKITSAKFSSDDMRILTIMSGGLATLWDLNGSAPIYFVHNRPICTAAFSPDGNQIFTASLDKKARLWNLKGKILANFDHERPVDHAAFSPDGKRVVTASRDKAVKVWLTPSAILQWLKSSKISKLPEKDKRELQED